MNELTIIKRGGAAYIDSREVAEIIGKNHKELLRDIRRYDEILHKVGQRNFAPTSFFVESSFIDGWNRTQPCYLITRKGADVIANKLTGEKGVLFTAAYVTKFHEMSEREHAAKIAELKAQAVTPKLKVFNAAIRNVLNGYSQTCASPRAVMSFLRGAYKPFGIAVAQDADSIYTFTATGIARILGVYSESGLPHGHAIASIIDKLNIPPGHIEIVAYGTIGLSVRYDVDVLNAVEFWLADNDYPRDIPHRDFEYHLYYDRNRAEQLSLFDDDDDGWFKDEE